MRILGLIPARGGSKGIPRKNIKILGGKPLIQYAINSGLKADGITKVVVSTDDQEIADVSLSCGAIIPGLRPDDLASDTSPTIDTVIYILEKYKEEGEEFDAVCLLQATYPFRTSLDVDNAIERFRENEVDCLISVIPVPHEYNPHWVFEPDGEGNLKIATGEEEIISRRQELPSAYIRNGAIYITKSSVILKQKSLYGKSIGYFEMSMEKHVNLDTMDDWRRAEQLVKEVNA